MDSMKFFCIKRNKDERKGYFIKEVLYLFQKNVCLSLYVAKLSLESII